MQGRYDPQPISSRTDRVKSMFERMAGASGRIVGYRISGVLTGEEAKAILIPELGRVATTYGYAHLLLHLDRLEGETPEAFIEELKNLPLIRKIRRIAVVGDSTAEALAAAISDMLLSRIDTRIRHFRTGELQEAWDWLHEGGVTP
ncbi:STAS/SEC14 domain-containing protein [Methanoculleus sp. FWC-SCC1]|uniref:STAS/SEC14 domain-containing protein n=2 Tax=Methanoculleus frigidifontis TaxID=2584085 RepID=A0ABT8MAH5_9EURY|nr:STAS/SEC14 domain-containing protein [Methanoculleus sp. FWC-SCC1]